MGKTNIIYITHISFGVLLSGGQYVNIFSLVFADFVCFDWFSNCTILYLFLFLF